MKKIYSSIAVIAMLGSTSLAQVSVHERSVIFPDQTFKQFPTEKAAGEKALGTTVWSDDFSTPANWVAENDGQSAPFGWNIGSTSNAWTAPFTGGINSTSGGNYAEVYNGDYAASDQAIDVTYTLTTASSIDIQTLAGNEYVTLQYEQYGARFNDLQQVQISTNGTTWVTVGDNNDATAYVGNNPTAIYANPESKSISLAPYIAGNAGTVWIRFSWTSAVGGVTPNAWTTFGWYIDDVKIVSSSDFDLKAVNADWGTDGLHYHQIPTAQIAPIEFSTSVSNEGTSDQTNAVLNVDVNTGLFTGTSPAGVTITSFATDSLIVSSTFTPSGNGTFDFTWDVSSDQVDDVPANNVLEAQSFEVNDYIYARDNDAADGTIFNGGEGYEVGNLFGIYSDATVYSIGAKFSSSSQGAPVVKVKLYLSDASGFVFMEESDEYTLTSSDMSSGAYINFPLLSPVSLTTGEAYLAVISAYGDGGDTQDMVVSAGGQSAEQTSFLYDTPTGTWFFVESTPMVRMNFDPASGVEELTENGINLGQNTPNPISDISTINFNLEAGSDVRFEFTDLMGRTVKSLDLGSLSAGAHSINVSASEFAAGVYNYTLIAGDRTITNKMIVE